MAVLDKDGPHWGPRPQFLSTATTGSLPGPLSPWKSSLLPNQDAVQAPGLSNSRDLLSRVPQLAGHSPRPRRAGVGTTLPTQHCHSTHDVPHTALSTPVFTHLVFTAACSGAAAVSPTWKSAQLRPTVLPKCPKRGPHGHPRAVCWPTASRVAGK